MMTSAAAFLQKYKNLDIKIWLFLPGFSWERKG